MTEESQRSIRMHIAGVSPIVKSVTDGITTLKLVLPNGRQPRPSQDGKSALAPTFAFIKVRKVFVDVTSDRKVQAETVENTETYCIFVIHDEFLSIDELRSELGVDVRKSPEMTLLEMKSIAPGFAQIDSKHLKSPDPKDVTLRLDVSRGSLSPGVPRKEKWEFRPGGLTGTFPEDLILEAPLEGKTIQIQSQNLDRKDTQARGTIVLSPKPGGSLVEFYIGNDPLNEILNFDFEDPWEAGQHFELYFNLTSDRPSDPPRPYLAPGQKTPPSSPTGKTVIHGTPRCPPPAIFTEG